VWGGGGFRPGRWRVGSGPAGKNSLTLRKRPLSNSTSKAGFFGCLSYRQTGKVPRWVLMAIFTLGKCSFRPYQ